MIEDASDFVSRAQHAGPEQYSYDYIIHDVFTGGAEPVNLFTQEFLQGLSELLKPDGVIAIVRVRLLVEPIQSRRPVQN